MNPIRIVIVGLPQPKGSAKIVPLRRQFPFTVTSFRDLLRSVAITSDNANVKAWQKAIAKGAQLALGGVELEVTGAVEVEAVFYFLRPKAHKKTDTRPHVVRPDCDKLARSVADALTGILYHDDSQITDYIARKRYASPGESARVEITITPISAEMPLFTRGPSHGTTDRIVVERNIIRPVVAAAGARNIPW